MGHILRYSGRKNASTFGLVVLGISLLLAGLFTKFESRAVFVITFCLIRFLHGASQAFVQVTTYSIIAT